MLVGDPDLCPGFAGVYRDDHIQQIVRLQGLDLHRCGFHVGPQTLLRLLCDLGNDLQAGVFIAAEHADACRRGDSASASGIGNDDALDVLDDVAARLDTDAVRLRAEGRARDRGAVGQGDRLRAAHGANEFALKDLHVGLVDKLIPLHSIPLFYISENII